jgi:type VI secretion system secreted protein Hcp
MAVVDYFLKIDGIAGESVDSKHKDEIELESFSWGETNVGPAHGGAGGGGAGKVQMQNLNFVMRVNKASPTLMLACATGKHIKQAVLTARKAGKTQLEFLVFKVTDVLVSSYQTGGSAHGDTLPMDQISFDFERIEVEYRSQKPDGSLEAPVKAGWNLKSNAPV